MSTWFGDLCRFIGKARRGLNSYLEGVNNRFKEGEVLRNTELQIESKSRDLKHCRWFMSEKQEYIEYLRKGLKREDYLKIPRIFPDDKESDNSKILIMVDDLMARDLNQEAKDLEEEILELKKLKESEERRIKELERQRRINNE